MTNKKKDKEYINLKKINEIAKRLKSYNLKLRESFKKQGDYTENYTYIYHKREGKWVWVWICFFFLKNLFIVYFDY